ncbi:MAG: polypeptide subunit release factor methylase [Candidatus Azotimanducaceae bacterium]|jgi:methylase of polypeptide subunit release factors
MKIQRIGAQSLAEFVGGGRAHNIGSSMLQSLIDSQALLPNTNVFEIGRGCGRAALPIASYLQSGRYVGVDLVDELVDFCNAEILPHFANVEFRT